MKNQNPYLIGAMVVSLILTTGVIYLPGISDAFGFEHITLMEYGISMALAFSTIPIVEVVKFFQRRVADK